MERMYRAVALQKKKTCIKLLGGVLLFTMCVLLLQGKTEAVRAALAETVMQPALFKFQHRETRTPAPLYVQLMLPKIFAFTWQEEVPAFSITEVAQKEVTGEQVISMSVATEAELSLLQENLYISGANSDGVFENGESTDVSEMIASDRADAAGNGSTGMSDASGSVNAVGMPANGNADVGGALVTGNEGMHGIGSLVQGSRVNVLQQLELEKYTDLTRLIKDFYVVDASTSPDAGLLDIEELAGYDCTIDKNAAGPQVLIYHSHSQEGFADSVAGDESTTIVGAGEKLAGLLEEYGFQVLHHKGVYDSPSRDDAYSNALPAIEKLLAENPSIQVVIDLHRDAVAEGTKLVKTIDGKDYARFMFFNGTCRGVNGPITYLSNPYLKENLAFSFQSQVIAENYFPGITRKIYLKAWRYNMHLKPRNMLIELGAQTNTVEEVMNTTEILAFIINEVLSGQ